MVRRLHQCTQEAEAAECSGVRSSVKTEALKAEIEGQVAELGGALTALDAVMHELSSALAGGKGPGTLLCLQDLQVRIFTPYWNLFPPMLDEELGVLAIQHQGCAGHASQA